MNASCGRDSMRWQLTWCDCNWLSGNRENTIALGRRHHDFGRQGHQPVFELVRVIRMGERLTFGFAVIRSQSGGRKNGVPNEI